MGPADLGGLGCSGRRRADLSTHDQRRKARNLRRDPRASVTVFAADDPYRTVDIRGTVELVDDPDHAGFQRRPRLLGPSRLGFVGATGGLLPGVTSDQ
jgi:pyridoxine/pyridoxamine 5'-phosphate oxidase